MLRRIAIVIGVAVCLHFAAAGALAAALTVSDLDDENDSPLHNHAELSCGNVEVGQCGAKSLMLVNRGDRSIAFEWNVSGHGHGFDASWNRTRFGTPRPTAHAPAAPKSTTVYAAIRPDAEFAGVAYPLDECESDGILQPGAECMLSVEFCPRTPGTKTGSIKMLRRGRVVYSFRLTGTGAIARTKK